MQSLTRLLSVALLATATASAAAATTTTYTPPSQRGTASLSGVGVKGNKTTDAQTIADTVGVVNQKSGAPLTARPDEPVGGTAVTVLDGQVVNGTAVESGRVNASSVARRTTGYGRVFGGTGTRVADRDAAVEGTAYLTYTLVNNATYNVDDCLAFCDRVPGCVFVNLYYEFNNALLDFVFSEHSNLKCTAYGDMHGAEEKTNWGGQLLEGETAPTYIQESSGWAVEALESPETPEGYEWVFGPLDAANNAPGYMGFAFIDKYDVGACAGLCSARSADTAGGACQFFNIWRALVDGVPTTYTCAFYYLVTDETTAVNYGQGSLKVSYSRGYRRTSLAVDGGFESLTCDEDDTFCFASSSGTWIGTSPAGGSFDASIFHYTGYSRSGTNVGLLGSASGADTLSGVLSPKAPLATVSGKTYMITFFVNTLYAGEIAEGPAACEVLWNGQVVREIRIGYRDWTYYETAVVARGKDRLAIRGGSAPAWIFIDDVYVFEH